MGFCGSLTYPTLTDILCFPCWPWECHSSMSCPHLCSASMTSWSKSLGKFTFTGVEEIYGFYRDSRRYALMLPVLALPVFMALPASFNLYWLGSSLIHWTTLNFFRFQKFRSFMGVPKFLPGTKAEAKSQGRRTESLIGIDFEVAKVEEFQKKQLEAEQTQLQASSHGLRQIKK